MLWKDYIQFSKNLIEFSEKPQLLWTRLSSWWDQFEFIFFNKSQNSLCIDLANQKVLQMNFLPSLNRNFKIELAACFTIWFSEGEPTIHLPDLFSIPSDLRAFHKSLALLTNFVSLFSKSVFYFFAMRFCASYLLF